MRFFIRTYGCQMNIYDSKVIERRLIELGHTRANSLDDAEFVIVNTCSVREHAEKRALGQIRQIASQKKRRKLTLIVIGCMATRLGDKLISEYGADYSIGADKLWQIEEIITGKKLTPPDLFTGLGTPPETGKKPISYVAISRGCSNFCSYCIVPYVRGPLRHRKPDEIIREIELLASEGVREITLIGQNVNSYRYGEIEFAELLKMVSSIEGIERIRFTTNHPKDLSDSVIEAISSLPKVAHHIHLPVQSGSNRILELMRRGYSREDYIALVEKLYKSVPDIHITTDVMVGFPTESIDDFEQTVKLYREVGFAGGFFFYYSVRPGTAASRMRDDVTYKEKIRRLNILINIGQELAEKKSEELIGTAQEVLVEEKPVEKPKELKGRISCGRVTTFEGEKDLIGRIVPVRIIAASIWNLRGKIENNS